MEQEKQIFNFLFEKFEQNENNKMNVDNLALELATIKEKISEILKPLLIDREGAKRLQRIQKLNENEKNFLKFTYFLFRSWNSYTELKDDDREIIIEFLNQNH